MVRSTTEAIAHRQNDSMIGDRLFSMPRATTKFPDQKITATRANIMPRRFSIAEFSFISRDTQAGNNEISGSTMSVFALVKAVIRTASELTCKQLDHGNQYCCIGKVNE